MRIWPSRELAHEAADCSSSCCQSQNHLGTGSIFVQRVENGFKLPEDFLGSVDEATQRAGPKNNGRFRNFGSIRNVQFENQNLQVVEPVRISTPSEFRKGSTCLNPTRSQGTKGTRASGEL